MNQAAKSATIWIHDYNLWLAPLYIREIRPDIKIIFFHHTPFPASDVFAILPWRNQILESLLSCDVVGFHIPRYAENFARAASSLLGAKKDSKESVSKKFISVGSALSEPSFTPYLHYGGRKIKIISSPVGTSPDLIANLIKSNNVENHIQKIKEGTKKDVS